MGNGVHGPLVVFECLPLDVWSMLDESGYDAMMVVARKDGLRMDAYDSNAFASSLGGWDDGVREHLAEKGEDVGVMDERREASSARLIATMKVNPGWPTQAMSGATCHGGDTGRPSSDWTTGADGRANTSERFEALTAEVERIILDSGFDLIRGRVGTVAGLIMAQLAHVHGLAPRKETP